MDAKYKGFTILNTGWIHARAPGRSFLTVFMDTVNQQILAARKFGVSQNKVIWRLFGGY